VAGNGGTNKKATHQEKFDPLGSELPIGDRIQEVIAVTNRRKTKLTSPV